MTLATVLMCTNTYDEYVHASINSVKSHNLVDVDFLLVANSVDDATYQNLVNLMTGEQLRICRTEMRGLTFSLNFGLHLISSKYVIRMDSDDICYAGRISEQIDFMEKNPDVAVCGSGYDLIDENNQVLKTVFLPQTNKKIRQSLYWSNPICHPAVILRREAIILAGAYSGEKSEDYELWLKLSVNPKNQFFNIKKALIGYRTPIKSQSRYSRQAYINVSLAQARMFLTTYNPLWLIGGFCTLIKLLSRGRFKE